MRKRLSTRRKLGFAAAALLLLLALVEVGCRVGEWALERANREELPARAAGELRVFAYGGSTTAGFPDPDVGFVRQLKHWLGQARQGPLRVVNLGKGAADSARVLRAVDGSIQDPDLAPDVAILLCGHNEFLRPDVRSSYTHALFGGGLLGSLATVRMISYGAAKLRARRFDLPDELNTFPRDGAAFAARIEAYQANLRAIADLCAARGVPLVLCTPPRNLSWAPVYKKTGGRRHLPPERYEAEVEACRALVDDGQLDAAETRLRAALEQEPDDAMFTWLLGRARQARGDLAGASPLLERACDLDPIPIRVLSQQDQFVRDLARERRLPLVDVEALIRGAAPGGVPGADLFVDNCHPTPHGNALIARAVLEALLAGGFLGEGARLPAEAGDAQAFLVATGQVEVQAQRRYQHLVDAGRYAMKEPWFNFALARECFEQVAALRPDGWEAEANLGGVNLLLGKREPALEHLRRATAPRGAPLDLNDDPATPYLRDALQRAGIGLAELGS